MAFRYRMVTCALLVCLCAAAPAQAIPTSQDAPQQAEPQRRISPADRTLEDMQRDAAKHQNEARQKSLKRDTDKLLDLATQLKQYVDKSNEHVLSLEVIRKAEEIEKLAHSVRDKMKAQYGVTD